MIEIDALKTEILELSLEDQKMVAEFVQFLKFKSAQTRPNQQALHLENQTFVGMWCDRDETQDSQKWVRNLRRSQWTR